MSQTMGLLTLVAVGVIFAVAVGEAAGLCWKWLKRNEVESP